jgi:hypothetical protein
MKRRATTYRAHDDDRHCRDDTGSNSHPLNLAHLLAHRREQE